MDTFTSHLAKTPYPTTYPQKAAQNLSITGTKKSWPNATSPMLWQAILAKSASISARHSSDGCGITSLKLPKWLLIRKEWISTCMALVMEWLRVFIIPSCHWQPRKTKSHRFIGAYLILNTALGTSPKVSGCQKPESIWRRCVCYLTLDWAIPSWRPGSCARLMIVRVRTKWNCQTGANLLWFFPITETWAPWSVLFPTALKTETASCTLSGKN